jgi:23S rRNA pseudouridine1911/1915/1917 synthase
VHRLDRGTSGVLVAARSDRAHRELARAFAAREVDKRYLALAYGAPARAAGRIDAPIGRHPRKRKEMTVRRDGREATTQYRSLAHAAGVVLLVLRLITGRTHQIRVHLKSAGHPLVGDPLYGEARWKGCPSSSQGTLRSFPRPALHAWRLAFEHPVGGEPLSFEALPPLDLCDLWRRLAGSDLAEIAAPGRDWEGLLV